MSLINYLIAACIFHELKSPYEKIASGLLTGLKKQLGETEFNKYFGEAVKELQSK